MENPIKLAITQGDPNGVGLEVILKTFQNPYLYEFCIPVLYASPKMFVATKKQLGLEEPNYFLIKSIDEAREGKLNLIISNDEPTEITFGAPSKAGGTEAFKSINRMLEDAKQQRLDAVVTAPIDKSTIEVPGNDFRGHTGYLAKELKAESHLMLLCSEELKVALVTEHVPLAEVSKNLTIDAIYNKIKLLNNSLVSDFTIRKPRIAVLGLNPHSGDNGLIGSEENTVIKPAIEKAYKDDTMVFGPYPADGFFGSGQYKQFDAILAMYHDQGLIPFKYMAFSEGVNVTCGLSIVRTSPDHGVAYDIAGKNIASCESFLGAVHEAINIVRRKKDWAEINSNVLRFSELRRERFRLE